MDVIDLMFGAQPLTRKLRFAEARAYEAPQHTEFFGEGESLVTSSITAQGDTTTLTMTMRFASRAERDGALETGMADGVAIGYDRLDAILAAAGPRK
jgi:uncharacterized protein YndB with AHSA1/START domain